MAQIPSQRQREVSLEVALPMQAGLGSALAQVRLFAWSCGDIQRQPIRRLKGRHCPRWQQFPNSLSLLEKEKLKPEQVEN